MASTPKIMSSRLATMKFMQRSATKSEPATPDGPPSKRRKLLNSTSTPSAAGLVSENEVRQMALAAEAKKREAVLALAAANSGETKWVLSFQVPHRDNAPPTLQVRQAGFAAIDAEDSSDEEEDRVVKMKFGGGLKTKKVVQRDGSDELTNTDFEQAPAAPVQSEKARSDSSSGSSGNSDSDDPMSALIRETRREIDARMEKSRDKLATETPKRPLVLDEDMDLGGLTSLSGGGGRPSTGSRTNSNVECYRCRQKGHISSNCPNAHTPRSAHAPRSVHTSRSAPRGSAGRGRQRLSSRR